MMKFSEMVRDGIAVLEQKGWHQGSIGDEQVGFCAIGALTYACYEAGVRTRACHTLLDDFQVFVGDQAVPEWNDKPSTTKEDVILKLKEYAVFLEDLGE